MDLRFRGQRIKISNNTPTPPFDITLNDEEKVFGSVYYAAASKKFIQGTDHNSVNAVHGDSVGRFVDLLGLHDLITRGIDQPAVIGVTEVGQKLGRPPILYTENEQRPSVEFPNVPYIPYQTDDFAGTPQSTIWNHSIMLVMRSRDGQGFEDWIGSGENRNYIANNGDGIRVGGTTEFFPDAVKSPPYNEISSLYVEFTSDWVDLWISGVYKGHIANIVNDNGNHAIYKTKNMIGTFTNSAPFDFMALYIAYGPQFNTVHNNNIAIQQSINQKWIVGTPLNVPYSINGTISLSNNVWTPHYTPVNASSEQIVNPQFRWFLLLQNLPGDGSGNFANQVLISKNPTLAVSDYSSYPETVNGIACYVWVGARWDKCQTWYRN